MPLRHFLYRCPDCGSLDVAGAGDRAVCEGCRVVYRRGRGGLIRSRNANGTAEVVSPAALARRMEEQGGPLEEVDPDSGPQGLHRARARVQRSLGEEPVYLGARLLGFREVLGDGSDGVLHAGPDGIHFEPDDGPQPLRWSLLDIQSLQGSSSTVQIRAPATGLVSFRLASDSPFRWEELLARLLRRAWEAAGRGTIVEFQPRIITAPGRSQAPAPFDPKGPVRSEGEGTVA